MLFQERQRQTEVQRQQITSLAGEVRALLEAELNASLHLTSGLITYIQARHGQLQASEIDPWLSGLIKQGRHIRNIGLAPGNRITYIYPLAGNEAALGLYYPDIPTQWPAVEQAIRERRPMLAGPVQLKQGGSGFVYRVPVYLDHDTYWGIISTVIKADQLLAMTTRMARDRGLDISLARIDAQGAIVQSILGQQNGADPAAIQLQVTIPGDQWLLTATQLKTKTSGTETFWLRSIGWLISLTLAVLVFLLLCANARRTAMLQALADSQQRFTRAFETAPQGMALLDLNGRWLDANDALCRLIGYTRDELRALTLSTLTHPNDVARFIGDHARSAQQELRLLSKSGASIDCLVSAAQVDSQPPSLIAQIQDIREQKHLERMKSEFVSTVSHELRTPLTSIAGSLGLVAGGALGEIPAEMRQMLDIAQQNSLRLEQLINDLLDMEKLAAGRMSFELREQALQPLLEEALANNRSYAEKYAVRFQLSGGSDLHVRVDGLRLQQVLANYLSNAAKFSPAGSTI
ncbi:MAG: PAS domain S-box protein, partial [Gammaproteobacteria bacterium]|nr:PAS domain S-box protein [Gammaproteobacteria bacterium]